MAHIVTSSKGAPVIVLEPEVAMPAFNFAPFMGRRPLDELETDLVLMTRLYRQSVPAALHVRDSRIGEWLKHLCKSDFLGKRGDTRLLEVPLSNSQGQSRRYIYLVGLGSATGYCGNTACNVFELYFKKALELNVRSAAVPFIPNPMTERSHKSTAFKMKTTLARVIKEHGDSPVSLKEVQIWCHANAVNSIRKALESEVAGIEDCRCDMAAPVVVR